MEPNPVFPRPLSYWRSVIFSVLLSVVGQGVLAVAIALGGSPAVGALAAVALAILSIILILAAAVRTARSHGPAWVEPHHYEGQADVRT